VKQTHQKVNIGNALLASMVTNNNCWQGKMKHFAHHSSMMHS